MLLKTVSFYLQGRIALKDAQKELLNEWGDDLVERQLD